MAQDTSATRLVEDFRVDLSAREIENSRLRDTRAIASQAHLYALPAFLHMRQLTEFIQGRAYMSPGEPPIGGWVLVRTLSDPKTDNRFPNVDTLYGAAYLLLAEHGPVVLSVPPIRDRYFSVALHDAYFNNFAIVGTSSGDVNGAKVLIVPPGWSGDVPSDVDRVIAAPTPIINLYQRIFVRSESEYDAVHALQDQITLTPLGGGPFPSLDLAEWNIPGMRGISDPLAMFGHAKRYIALNGCPPEDDGLVALFDTVGLGPNSALPTDPDQVDAVRAGSADAQDAIDARLSAGPFRNGWNVPDPEAGRARPAHPLASRDPGESDRLAGPDRGHLLLRASRLGEQAADRAGPLHADLRSRRAASAGRAGVLVGDDVRHGWPARRQRDEPVRGAP